MQLKKARSGLLVLEVGLLLVDELVDAGQSPNYRLVLLVLVVQHLRVLEVLDEAPQALQAGVSKLANLLPNRSTFSLLKRAQRRLWKCR